MPPSLDPSSRPRMPLACAECRRLKLKCDKNKPCSSCVRRGCASICPQGRMVSKGSRFILANTEQLHEKIDTLIGRVRQLERALEQSHSRHSHEPHILLGDDLRLIATPVEPATSEPEPVEKEDELAECMGTLTLDVHGTRYFGSTGACAFLWRDKIGADGDVYRHKGEVASVLGDLPPELAHMAHSFPVRLPTFDVTHFSTWILENCLPPFPEAWSLFENYWEHYAWHFTPITRHGFVEQIFSPLYHGAPHNSDKPLGHRLGLLFMVFAIGDLLDLTQPWVISRGLRYYLLARASLCLNPVLESPTVTALQAMHLIGVFLMMSRGTNEPEHAWVLSGINLKLALTLGLHHDPNKFDLSPEEVENRQYTRVAVVNVEIWQSLCVGRPPTRSFHDIDWVPSENQRSSTERDFKDSHRIWVASFIRDCTSQVLDTVVAKKALSYRAILQLDAKIREYPSIIDATDTSHTHVDELGVGTVVHRAFMSVIKEVSLLFLHRRSFALALRDFPDDPLKSSFAPSVVACHHSAITFVSKIHELHSAIPALSSRIWFIWPNVFVATLILGSIVARSPGCSLASSALLGLEQASQLWEAVSESVSGGRVLDIIRELKQKAFTAFAQNKAPRDTPGATPGGIEVLEEIHCLGGGGPRVLKQSQVPPSSTSSPYSTESAKVFSESSQSPPSSIPSDEYPPSHSSDKPVDVQPSGPFPVDSAANTFPSLPFDWENFDYSSHFLPPSDNNTQPVDFDSVLEQLGLGGEWQPVMDHLGL